MMQKLHYFLLFMALAAPIHAQFRVLFVDDSGDAFGNAEMLASSLDSLGYDYDYFDANGDGISPTLAQMNDYDLVIWYSSTWGVDLQLWSGSDSDNIELQQYLAQPDANLWLIGLDYFYDRYGPAPYTFQTGDFVFDFLGISKYDVQSYADDGNLGVPLVIPATGQPITGLTDISWVFSTLWYADGFEIRPEATSIYLFGGTGYVFNGKPTGVWHHPAGGARTLTYGFDLSLAANFDVIRTHVDAVLDWWQGELSDTKSPADNPVSVRISPNTFSDYLDIIIRASKTTPVNICLHDATGQLVARLAEHEIVSSGVEKTLHWQVPAGVSNGFYYCTVQSGRQIGTTKLVKMSR
ncbi:MAG: T9SS type A sorting domain-containing protein [Lewinellaceae bacterium]|nr:T9SS type A sorting domain-containing protein [Lewinellaceae bacterium]